MGAQPKLLQPVASVLIVYCYKSLGQPYMFFFKKSWSETKCETCFTAMLKLCESSLIFFFISYLHFGPKYLRKFAKFTICNVLDSPIIWESYESACKRFFNKHIIYFIYTPSTLRLLGQLLYIVMSLNNSIQTAVNTP